MRPRPRRARAFAASSPRSSASHAQLLEVDRLRRLELCAARALARGRIARVVRRQRRPGDRPRRTGPAPVIPARPSAVVEADWLDPLAVVASFLASPPPELKVVALAEDRANARCGGIGLLLPCDR